MGAFILNGEYNVQKLKDIINIGLDVEEFTLASRAIKYFYGSGDMSEDSDEIHISITTTLPGNIGFNSTLCSYITNSVEYAFIVERISSTTWRVGLRVYNFSNSAVTIQPFTATAKLVSFMSPVS